jgi:phenylacetaldehyde dehydrogenase
MNNLIENTKQYLNCEASLIIDGKRCAATGEESTAIINACNGENIYNLRGASDSDVDAAVAAARNAFNGGWKTLAPDQRAGLMLEFARLIDEHAEALGELESLECATPISVTVNTIRYWCAAFIRYYAGWADKIQGDTIPGAPFLYPDNQFLAYTKHEPVGVVAAITPWNAPIAMLVLKLGPALASGCSLVVKPAEMTPLTAIYIAELASKAGIPAGVVNVVQGKGETVGRYLSEHAGVDKISFTGSTAVGKRIAIAATGNLKKVSLELGGKSPLVIFPDANLEEAVPAAAMACFFLSGQNCMAATRLYVHESIHGEVVKGLTFIAQAMQSGDALNPETQLGPLISEQQRQQVHAKVEKAVAAGGILLAGGTIPEGPGFYYPPTLIDNTDVSMDIVQQEVFGPVLAISTFSDDIEALIRDINSTVYGLSGSVWTSDINKALKMADAIDSGQVGVNSHAALIPGVPFGGNKQSGWGREFGYEGLLPYLKTKAVTIKY